MKRLLLLLPAVAFLTTCFCQTKYDKLDAYFTAANQAGSFNGSVLITDNNTVVLQKGYGYKNAEEKQPADANTIYQIGSVTKQFTAAVILYLAEKGKLSLLDKVSKFYPNFPSGDKITIEHLLTHQSGIWNYTNDETFMRGAVYSPKSETDMMTLIAGKPLEFEPGSKFSYSNSGYSLLGYIIQKVSGKSYEQMVRQVIFEPLQMTHSGFNFTTLSSSDKAVGYSTISGASGQRSLVVDSSVSFSAGAIYTTVGDLYKWDQSLSTQKILKASSLNNAFTPRKSNYGFGWGIDTLNGFRRISHNGGIPGFLSANAIVPQKGITVILLNNSGVAKPDAVEKDVINILFDKPYTLPQAKTEVKLDEALLRQYVGKYQLSPQFFITITVEGGQLKAQATGQPSFDLFARNETTFFLKVIDAEVDFIKDNSGKVEKLILHQGGADVPGMKIE